MNIELQRINKRALKGFVKTFTHGFKECLKAVLHVFQKSLTGVCNWLPVQLYTCLPVPALPVLACISHCLCLRCVYNWLPV